jgi:hypothetical protein
VKPTIPGTAASLSFSHWYLRVCPDSRELIRGIPRKLNCWRGPTQRRNSRGVHYQCGFRLGRALLNVLLFVVRDNYCAKQKHGNGNRPGFLRVHVLILPRTAPARWIQPGWRFKAARPQHHAPALIHTTSAKFPAIPARLGERDFSLRP